MKPAEQHKLFWDLYPARITNGKRYKVGLYPCQLWFEAKKPDDETFSKICAWVKILRDNYEHSLKKGKFYAAPCDPLKFLKGQGWRDEIEPLTGVVKKVKMCHVCGGNATGQTNGKLHCPEHNPYKVPKFQTAEQRMTPSQPLEKKGKDTTFASGEPLVGAGSLSVPQISSATQAVIDKFRKEHTK